MMEIKADFRSRAKNGYFLSSKVLRPGTLEESYNPIANAVASQAAQSGL